MLFDKIIAFDHLKQKMRLICNKKIRRGSRPGSCGGREKGTGRHGEAAPKRRGANPGRAADVSVPGAVR